MHDRSFIGAAAMAVLVLATMIMPSTASAAIIFAGALNNDPTTTTLADNLFVGTNAAGSMTVNGGSTVLSANSRLGNLVAGVGTVTITDTGSTWTSSVNMQVGREGTGTLNILNGATVSNNQGRVGTLATGVGVVLVDGPMAVWNNSGFLNIGELGIGEMTISNGGVVTANTEASIGLGDTGNGSVVVTGADSQWIIGGFLEIAVEGTGEMTINGGGSVSNTVGRIGVETGSSGTVTVTGADSTWSNSNLLIVGAAGNGILNILDGGSVTNGLSGVLAIDSGASGTVNVSGADSTWNIIGGTLSIANRGVGTLNIADGGSVSSTGATIGVTVGSIGEVTVTGTDSSWSNVGSLVIARDGNGTLNIEAGGSVSNSTGVIAREPDSVGEVNVTGTDSLWTNSGALNIGEGGAGTLNITAAGSVTNTDSTIANALGSTGNVTVHGADSTWTNSGTLTVGYTGDATLRIEDGGLVTGVDALIATTPSSTSSVTVSGTDATLNNSGILVVGIAGEGTLTIENGGTVSNPLGASISSSSPSVSTVTVTGTGSSWTSAGIDVGKGGNGTLTIADGGTVNNTFVSVAADLNSIGLVTVSGTGSNWNSDGTVMIGRFSQGTLLIEDGGTATNLGTTTDIASGTNSIGVATVTGTGSTWNNSGNLTVGNSGQGTLTIEDGGTVNAATADLGVFSTASAMVTVTNADSSLNVGGLNIGTFDAMGTLAITDNALVNVTGDTIVGPQGLLSGNSTLNTANLTNIGTIAPGTSIGTLTIGGNFAHQSGGLLDFEFDQGLGTNDMMHVTGNTLFNAGSFFQFTQLDADPFAGTEEFLVITSDGTITDDGMILSLISPNFALLFGEVRNGGSEYWVTLLSELEAWANTPNNRRVARSIDRSIANGIVSPELTAVVDLLGGAGDQDTFNRLLNQLSPEAYGTVSQTAFWTVQRYNRSLMNALARQHRSKGTGVAELDMDLEPVSETQQHSVGLNSVREASSPDDLGLIVFGQVFGAYADRGHQTDRVGYRASIVGFSAGVGFEVAEDIIAGLSLGYSYNNISADNNTRFEVNSLRVGPFVTWTPDQWTVEASATFGVHWVDGARGVPGGTANSDYNAFDFSLYTALGYTFEIEDIVDITPFGSLEYTYYQNERFRESGGPMGTNLNVASNSTNFLRTVLGVRVGTQWEAGGLTFVPQGYVGWAHEYLNDNNVSASFVGVGTPFTVASGLGGRNSAVYGVGLSVQINSRVSAFIRYDGEAGDRYNTNGGSIGISIGF